jgi:oligosaccharyltransferase complex subunit alpha (ribophorin I)
LAYQIQVHYQNPAAHTLSSLALRLPPGIRNAYYYDLVGNVSTSRLRTAPSPLKRSSAAAANQYSLLDLRPRYPVLGGWNYSFTLGWDAPLRDSASWDKQNGRYIVGVPLMTQINDAVVNDMEFKIVLPEGATYDILILPFCVWELIVEYSSGTLNISCLSPH